MTNARKPSKPKKLTDKLPVKHRAPAKVPAKAVFVDHEGVPVAEVPFPAPLPESEWRRIWNVLTALVKGPTR